MIRVGVGGGNLVEVVVIWTLLIAVRGGQGRFEDQQRDEEGRKYRRREGNNHPTPDGFVFGSGHSDDQGVVEPFVVITGVDGGI